MVCLFLCFFCFEGGLTSCRLVIGPGGPGGPGGPEMLCPSSPLLPLKTLKGLYQFLDPIHEHWHHTCVHVGKPIGFGDVSDVDWSICVGKPWEHWMVLLDQLSSTVLKTITSLHSRNHNASWPTSELWIKHETHWLVTAFWLFLDPIHLSSPAPWFY